MQHDYFLPPEWAMQSGLLLTWPHLDSLWIDMLPQIERVFIQVATEVSYFQPVIISCQNSVHQAHVFQLLRHANAKMDHIHCHIAKANDIWVRDHGPISVFKNKQPVLLDFTFNGWGNKHAHEKDNLVTQQLHQQAVFHSTMHEPIDLILEGGAIEVDGQGTLLMAKSCVLNPNRNTHHSQLDIEKKLASLFGINKTLWLDHGYLEGDDTDGHIDTLARFTDPNTIVYTYCDDPTDSHYETFQLMQDQLRSFRNHENKPYQLIPLPWTSAVFADSDKRRLPANYANFLIINDAVLLPTYNDAKDPEAIDLLKQIFPNRKIIPIPATTVVQWNGSIHCMTMQLPKGIFV